MGFSINTNINAVTAMDHLNSTQSTMSKSMTRLSTGLRINGAADDPSGLIASKRMSAQISSMAQAQSNTQDAINYGKTADGALDEVNTLLENARTLAVASGNSATLTPDQLQANQQQLQSIVDSVSRIASTTQYDSKKILDGSAGTTSAVTDGSKVASLAIGGTIGGKTLAANAAVTLNVTTAAAQATASSKAFAFATTTLGATAGSFTINGTTFSSASTDTASDVVNQINKASQQTGVVASYEGTAIKLKTSAYGAGAAVDVVDSTGAIMSAAGATHSVGVNAVATVDAGQGAVAFTGGQNGRDGMVLSDSDGNTLKLTAGGNLAATGAVQVGQVVVGSSSFQIGANAGQTAQLSLGNFASAQLGNGAVAGKNMGNLDLTTASGATDALKVIDQAIGDVTTSRGRIGNFQKNVLESNSRNLTTAKENLTASLSTVQDVDVASEMTNYTRLQILQSTGMAILSQAKSAPQSVLQLLQ